NDRGDIEKLDAAISPLGDSVVIARATEAEANVHIHTSQAGEVIEKAFGLGEVTNLRLEVLPAKAQVPEKLVDDTPRVIVSTRDGELAKLFRSIGATNYTPAMTLGDDDILVGTARGIELGGAEVVPVSSNVEAIAAISVYAPGPGAVTAMVEVARAMRVDKPSDETVGAILACCHNLVRDGDEQLTI